MVVVVNGKLTPEGREKFSKLSDDFFVRENVGYDVWAYHDALDYIGWDELKKYDELILANYTLFGPFYPLSEAFAAMEDKKCDWWGLHRDVYKRQVQVLLPLPPCADVAQQAEHLLGKEEVVRSNRIVSSKGKADHIL